MKTIRSFLTVCALALLPTTSFAELRAVSPSSSGIQNISFTDANSVWMDHLLAGADVHVPQVWNNHATRCKEIFRPLEKVMPLVADAQDICRGESSDKYYAYHQFYLTVGGIMDAGLSFRLTFNYARSQWSGNRSYFSDLFSQFTGDFEVTNCFRDGKSIFKRATSLAAVFESTKEAPSYDLCILNSKRMLGRTPSATDKNAYPSIDNVRIELRPNSIKLMGNMGGRNFETPFMYYDYKHPKYGNGNEAKEKRRGDTFPSYLYVNDNKLSKVQTALLDILDGALQAIQAEEGNDKLPGTVAYLLDKRKEYVDMIQEIPREDISANNIADFIVSMKNGFMILDQAVGLASKNQITLGSTMGIKANLKASGHEERKSRRRSEQNESNY